jgi:hypothetical protein
VIICKLKLLFLFILILFTAVDLFIVIIVMGSLQHNKAQGFSLSQSGSGLHTSKKTWQIPHWFRRCEPHVNPFSLQLLISIYRDFPPPPIFPYTLAGSWSQIRRGLPFLGALLNFIPVPFMVTGDFIFDEVVHIITIAFHLCDLLLFFLFNLFSIYLIPDFKVSFYTSPPKAYFYC